MGNQCTKVNKNGGAEKGEEGQSNDTPDLSSYQSACEEDPELQRFDSVLQQRTSLALNSISVNTDYRSLSLESLREVTLCFLDMNQGVVNFILESKKDIWKDPDIFDVVKDYLDSSIHIMNFCASLDDCLERAHSSQSIILVALEKFENETKMVVNEGDLKPLFSETLEQLRSFKDVSGDPFTAKFFSAFHSVYLQQQALLSKIKSKKSKLDKKLSRVRIWKRVSNIIFATVFVSAIICSIVAAAVTAPPMVTALAAAASVPLGTVGKWINSMWKKYEDELKREREILTTMQAGSFVVIQDLEHIRVLAEKLQIIFEGLLQSADFAITQTDALASAMEEVKKNVNGFSETIEVLSQHAKKCNQDIRMARAVILRKIVSQPSSSNQGSGVFLYIQKQSKQAIKEINLHTYKEMEIEKVEKEMKQSKIKKICVFCGSSSGKKSSYKEAAVELGKELVSRNIDLVYGGGSVGLMGLVSQAVYNGGRHVLGVIPRALMPRELTGETVGEVETVADMHQRKAEMAKHSDAFIALPGGYGTLEELLEVITWAQLGIHDKPVGLLNVDGYYNSFLTLVDKAVEEGFIWPKARQIFVSAPTAKELMNKLEEYARSHENVALKLDWEKEEVPEYIPPSNGRYITPSYIP